MGCIILGNFRCFLDQWLVTVNESESSHKSFVINTEFLVRFEWYKIFKKKWCVSDKRYSANYSTRWDWWLYSHQINQRDGRPVSARLLLFIFSRCFCLDISSDFFPRTRAICSFDLSSRWPVPDLNFLLLFCAVWRSCPCDFWYFTRRDARFDEICAWIKQTR